MTCDDRPASERIHKKTTTCGFDHLSTHGGIDEISPPLGPGVAALGIGSHEDDHVPEVSRGRSFQYSLLFQPEVSAVKFSSYS